MNSGPPVPQTDALPGCATLRPAAETAFRTIESGRAAGNPAGGQRAARAIRSRSSTSSSCRPARRRCRSPRRAGVAALPSGCRGIVGQGPASGRRRAGSTGPPPVQAQQLLGASDGVALLVEEGADLAQDLDVLGAVVAPTAAALQRPDLRELALPEAQHVLRHVEIVRHLADRPEGRRGLGWREERSPRPPSCAGRHRRG